MATENKLILPLASGSGPNLGWSESPSTRVVPAGPASVMTTTVNPEPGRFPTRKQIPKSTKKTNKYISCMEQNKCCILISFLIVGVAAGVAGWKLSRDAYLDKLAKYQFGIWNKFENPVGNCEKIQWNIDSGKVCVIRYDSYDSYDMTHMI